MPVTFVTYYLLNTLKLPIEKCAYGNDFIPAPPLPVGYDTFLFYQTYFHFHFH